MDSGCLGKARAPSWQAEGVPAPSIGTTINYGLRSQLGPYVECWWSPARLSQGPFPTLCSHPQASGHFCSCCSRSDPEPSDDSAWALEPPYSHGDWGETGELCGACAHPRGPAHAGVCVQKPSSQLAGSAESGASPAPLGLPPSLSCISHCLPCPPGSFSLMNGQSPSSGYASGGT